MATRPIANMDAYRQKLNGSVFKSALIMRPVFEAARQATRRIIFAEGEDERVLRAANAMLEETTDKPILIGRPDVIASRCERAGLPIRPDRDFEIVNPASDSRYRDYWQTYHELMERRGVTPDTARAVLRTNTTAIGAVAVHRGDADSLICGTFGQYLWHLKYVREVLARGGLRPHGALSLMIQEDGPLFIADTAVNPVPSPEQIAETVCGAVRHAKRFGVLPKVALCSHSNFGNLDSDSGRRMRAAMEILQSREVDFAYEGEMNVDVALDPDLRARIFPHSRLEGAANNSGFRLHRCRLNRAQRVENESGWSGGWPHSDGNGQPRPYCHPVDHRARTFEHVRRCGHPCGGLRITLMLRFLAIILCLATPAMAKPTLVFLPGLGDGRESFAKVAHALEGVAPIYADARPETMPGDEDGKITGAEVAADLHNRLQAAGLAPPYILVGHSIGGTYALSYAQAFPNEIAAIVLADARLAGFEEACRAANLKACVIPDLLYRLMPASQKREIDGMEQTFAALQDPASLGDIAITVIVATRPAPGLGADWQSVWIQTATQFAGALANGRLVRAEGSRHYVQREAAKLVEAEIRLVLDGFN